MGSGRRLLVGSGSRRRVRGKFPHHNSARTMSHSIRVWHLCAALRTDADDERFPLGIHLVRTFPTGGLQKRSRNPAAGGRVFGSDRRAGDYSRNCYGYYGGFFPPIIIGHVAFVGAFVLAAPRDDAARLDV